MINLDTVKLKASFEKHVLEFNEKHREIDMLYSERTGELDTIRTNSKAYPGITRITLSPASDKITIEFSGKILGKDYPKLINKNTAEQALEGLNKIEWIKFDTKKLLDDSLILKADITKDLDIGKYKHSEVLQALESTQLKRQYTRTPYSGQGMMITKNAKSNNCMQKFYNKELEILKEKNFLCPMESFKGKMRMEISLRKFIYLRKYLGIGQAKELFFSEILQMKKNPNWAFYSEYKEPEHDLFKEAEKYNKPAKFYSIEGKKSICRQLNYDTRTIFTLIRPLYSSKQAAYKAIRQDFVPLIQALQAGGALKEREIIQYIEGQAKEL